MYGLSVGFIFKHDIMKSLHIGEIFIFFGKHIYLEFFISSFKPSIPPILLFFPGLNG